MIPDETAHDAMRFRYPEELQVEARAELPAPAEWPMALVLLIGIALLSLTT
jgi:hypothetical protein